MLTIVLKISIIWSLLLGLYFLLLSQEKAAKWNRLYLWISLMLGIIIPLVENPFSVPESSVNAVAPSVGQSTINLSGSIEAQTQVAETVQSVDWSAILLYVWLIGVVVQALILTKNAFQLYFLKKYSSLQQHPIANYYTNNNTPAAFSFGKTIFLPNDAYSQRDLDLILQHEKSHHSHRHWIDNVLLELLQIVLWAHPLFYIFKKQIKLVHEYEVDADIDAADCYDYGRLLLAQNNKTYRTVLVHAFNFSPLKKRIAMMTNTNKAKNWKFLLALPLVGLCFTLMSAQPKSDERVREGNITIFRDNTIEWSGPKEVEITVIDPTTGEENKINVADDEELLKCNHKNVIKEGVFNLNTGQREFSNDRAKEIFNNIYVALLSKKKKFPSYIANIEIKNLVLDKNLDVYYYDVGSIGERGTDTSIAGMNRFSEVNAVVDNVLKNKKLINPKGLKLDNDFTVFNIHVGFKPMNFTAAVKTEDYEKIKKDIDKQQLKENSNSESKKSK